jgi:hypothetical protein
MATSGNTPDPRLVNQAQEAAVLNNSVRMTQNIASLVVNPATSPVVNIAPRNVGLILGFIVTVTGGVTNGATNTITRTGFGSSNILRNITFTDLNNVQRINTSGYHLAMLNSARQGFGFGGAYAPNLPMGYGNNWAPFAGPATIAGSGTGTVTHTYYVPLAAGIKDLRGAVYGAVVNATMNLQLTVNATPIINTGDPLNAIYTGNTGGAWTNNVTINVYQVYLRPAPDERRPCRSCRCISTSIPSTT